MLLCKFTKNKYTYDEKSKHVNLLVKDCARWCNYELSKTPEHCRRLPIGTARPLDERNLLPSSTIKLTSQHSKK